MPRIAVLLATLLLLATAVLGVLGTHRALKDARDIERIVSPIHREVTLLAAGGNPRARHLQSLARHPHRLRLVAVGFALLSLLAVSSLLLAYFGLGVPWATLLMVATAGALCLGSPHYRLGPGEPLSAQQWALLTATTALLGALSSLGVALTPSRAVARVRGQARAAASG